ncbi:MAG: hypothetical protein KJO73_08330, partial [Croceitalea sp.]|nr:hypothetical protein [Croceitalea sp.]
MRTSKYILLTVLVLLAGCKPQPKTKEITNNDRADGPLNFKGTTGQGNKFKSWTDAVNSKNTKAIAAHYTKDAFKVIAADSVIAGAITIAEHYKQGPIKIVSIKSLYSVKANEQRGIEYELINITTHDTMEQVQLVIWQKEMDATRRILEFNETRENRAKKVDL